MSDSPEQPPPAVPVDPLPADVPLQRYKLTIAYRGTNYHGWQTQYPTATYKGPKPPEGEGIPTIQEIVTRTLRTVVRHPLTLSGSSRTDAGVHAKGQVAHFTTDKVQIPILGMRRAVNARLPEDILVRSIEPVPINFDAVKWTLSKRYQYSIWNEEDRPVMFPDLAWHRWQKLDLDAIRYAASQLVGTHDFATFCRPGHGKLDTVRTVLACDVTYRKPRLVIGVEGTGFLWNMVRIIVGTLVEIGLGKYRADDVTKMLEAKDRRAAGGTAPPHGLYLQWIKFGDGPTRRGGDEDE
ncbi:tRNA pseudouridine(38-40) synthase TruA [Humisphaera borealis]|uniref:tRNA pseudouridine synthase A n=1 Tax=Humisphaera borealis TaxID=2807512 RepID=A0A7M2WRP6_9BACT|nr:tRNA pseudouridine(38-40) synthase TruA [Humisphaera borealis]QOV88103.1 tRNA pseudouridine(38-40) synthase TruA [Humisphaera borealis]